MDHSATKVSDKINILYSLWVAYKKSGNKSFLKSGIGHTVNLMDYGQKGFLDHEIDFISHFYDECLYQFSSRSDHRKST